MLFTDDVEERDYNGEHVIDASLRPEYNDCLLVCGQWPKPPRINIVSY